MIKKLWGATLLIVAVTLGMSSCLGEDTNDNIIDVDTAIRTEMMQSMVGQYNGKIFLVKKINGTSQDSTDVSCHIGTDTILTIDNFPVGALSRYIPNSDSTIIKEAPSQQLKIKLIIPTTLNKELYDNKVYEVFLFPQSPFTSQVGGKNVKITFAWQMVYANRFLTSAANWGNNMMISCLNLDKIEIDDNSYSVNVPIFIRQKKQ